MIDISGFCDYLELYPYSDDPDYDGIHDGGYKGLRPDAPPEAVEAYARFCRDVEAIRKAGGKP